MGYIERRFGDRPGIVDVNHAQSRLDGEVNGALSMPFIRAGELTAHYDLSGPSGAPVIAFANSLGTNTHVWDAQAAGLAGRFRILRYDMRGHGLTDCPPVPANGAGYTIDGLVDDALGLLDALGIDRVHFCGLSIGGMVGQRLAARAPGRVSSLILCDTANRIGPSAMWDERVATVRARGLAAIAERVLERWFTGEFRAKHAEEAQGFANMLVRTPADGYIGCCLAIRDADLRRDGEKIDCPTLVICGDEDQATTPEAARNLADSIDGAHLEIVDGAAHISCVERPEAVTGLISGFLKENGIG
jgi:3-oxoadipate enol-lactonase